MYVYGSHIVESNQRFTPSLNPSNMLVSINIQSLTLCHLFVEPVGTTRPKFDSRLESSSIAERQGSAMALTCLAQSNPAPVFRFVLWGYDMCEEDLFESSLRGNFPSIQYQMSMVKNNLFRTDWFLSSKVFIRIKTFRRFFDQTPVLL